MQNIPYFKIGDTLRLPVQWLDEDTGDGVEITGDVKIECKLLTSYGTYFFPEVIIDSDQVNRKGFFYLYLSSDITSTFQPCTITTDFKITIMGDVRHSQDFSFSVKRGIS